MYIDQISRSEQDSSHTYVHLVTWVCMCLCDVLNYCCCCTGTQTCQISSKDFSQPWQHVHTHTHTNTLLARSLTLRTAMMVTRVAMRILKVDKKIFAFYLSDNMCLQFNWRVILYLHSHHCKRCYLQAGIL